jgi:hypothetical protein
MVLTAKAAAMVAARNACRMMSSPLVFQTRFLLNERKAGEFSQCENLLHCGNSNRCEDVALGRLGGISV